MQPRPLGSDDKNTLTSLTQCQFAAVAEKDWKRWAGASAPDVVLWPANQPLLEGRDAVVQWLQALPPLSDMETTIEEVDGHGDAAFTRGSADATVALDGVPIEVRFRWLKTFSRQGDGTWIPVSDFLTYR